MWRLCWKMGCNLLFSALFFFGGGIRLSSDQWQSKQNQTAGKTLTNSSSIHSSSKKLSIAVLIFRPSSLHFISKIIFFFWLTRLGGIFRDVLVTFQIDRNDCNFFRVSEINFGASLLRRSVSDQVLSFEPIWEISFFFASALELNFRLWFVTFQCSELFSW